MKKLFKVALALFMAFSLVNVNPIINAEENNDVIVFNGIDMNKTDFVPGDLICYGIHISEEVKNVSYIELTFFQPMNESYKTFERDYYEEDFGNINGSYSIAIQTDDTFQNGKWSLYSIYFHDLDGNYLYVYNDPEDAEYSDETTLYTDLDAYSFNFSGATNIDLESPSFVDVSVNKRDVLVGEDFFAYVSAKDNSGLQYAWVTYTSPSGEHEITYGTYFDNNLAEETVEITLHIYNENYEAGAWELTAIDLLDTAGNYYVVNSDDFNFDHCSINLTKKDVNRLEITNSNIKVEAGDEFSVHVKTYVDDVQIYDDITYTTTSDIIEIDQGGFGVAKALGTAVVTATTKNGLTATCTVNVVEYNASVYRFAGDNRYVTAFKTANFIKLFMGAPSTVIIANGENFADALAGSYLAAAYGAPILMTNKKSETITSVLDYIVKNAKAGARVYILGGKNAVDESIDAYLKDRNYDVKRLAGKDRYETNLLILNEVGGKQNHIIVATGTGFADSLSASALGKPILLVGNSLTNAQIEYLKQNMEAEIRIIGGTAAVSSKVESQCKNYGYVKRIAGANRYETSIKVAENYFHEIDGVTLAYAQNFPDGLSAGPLAYLSATPLILTDSSKNNKLAMDFVKERKPQFGFTVGGSKLITDDTLRNMFSLLPDDEIYKNLSLGR